MGFTENYFALWEKDKKGANNQSKKKKKKETTGNSFTDNYFNLMEEEEDIAPVAVSSPLFVNKTAPLFNNDSVAPITVGSLSSEKEEEDERKWFEKGAFEDGYQFGDVIKTILGTSDDLKENLLTGVLGMGEKTVDAGAYIVGGIGGLLGNEKFQSDTAEFIKKDLYNEEEIAKKIVSSSLPSRFNSLIGGNSEESSLLGEKSDALVQSAGQLAGTMGLQLAGVPWFVTSGVVGFGNEVENALNEGASYGKAGLSATISAGAEILTEKLFGGSGLGETGLIAVDSLTKGISNKVVKALADYGVDVLAEGSEEVVSQFLSNLGSSLYKEKKLGEILFSEEAIDGYIESFIGGGVLGGVMNASNAINSVRTGRDYRSGLSANEQKVVQKEVENRIAEQEQNGKKLTSKEKAAIEEAVARDMERGYISTDTIEEVLGGDTYTMHRDTIARETEMQEEYDALYKMKNGDKSDEQIDRQAELKQQLEDIKQNFNRNQLGDEVMSLVNGSRLAESYNERARRGQAYEADLTKYTSKQKETIQKAIDSGILNNTNRTHEFVDMVAKITADKGVLFDFTNNERLKESGFAVDGKAVNGYVTKDGVTLNIDSAKSLNSVVGHEITHVLEGTELYDTLKQTITQYAKSKGDYQSRYDALAKLYESVDGADVDAELTADLVGDYLFTDREFIRNLSVTNKNVFQKVWDEIKYLYKVATAGSKEARELEKLKKAFEDAYREGGDGIAEIKYHLSSNAKTELHKALYDTQYRSEVLLRDVSPAIMTSQKGVKNLPMAMKASHIRENIFTEEEAKSLGLKVDEHTHYHGLGEDFFLQVIDGLDNVKLAYRGTKNATDPTRRENYFLLVSEFKDKAGNTVNVPVYIDEHAQVNRVFIDTNKISTVFGRDAFQEYINRQIRNGDLVRIKNRDIQTSERYAPIAQGYGEDVSRENVPQEQENVKFSLSEPVEETKDLVALHNLTADKLSKSLELGGLPMPSLAITKADIPHSNFGEITMIFGKDTIDPKANKKNKVYSADAWTPVFPRVEYESDSKVENAIYHRLRGLEGKIDDSFQRDLGRLTYGFEDYLNSQGGEEGLIRYAMDNYGLKAAYLEEQGKHIDKVTKRQEVEKGFNPDAADKYLKIMDILGVSTAEEIGNINLKDAKDNHGAELEAVYPGITKAAFRMSKVFTAAQSYLENKDSSPVYNTVADIDATRKAVDDALDQAGYEAWVRNLFAGIVKDSGIYNNKDIFTPSGNRRSFKQTHLPVTLENIVKAMAGQNDGKSKNVSGFNGIKTLRAATAETFKSVDQMHQKKGRLQNLTDEQVEALQDGLQTRLFNVMEAIDSGSENHGETNRYIRFDSIGDILTEIGESGKFGIADIQRVFQQYSKTVSDDTALEVKQLLYDVSQMPVNIFEAKPERVVGFDEAKVFVIPNNADVKLKQELLNRGYAIAEYDPNIEGHRQQVVNQFEEYKFSLSDAGETPKQYGNFNTYGKDIALETQLNSENATDNSTLNAESEVPVAESQLFPDDIAPMPEDEETAQARLASLTDADAPVETETPYTEDEDVTVDDPFEERDWYEVGNRKVKAYMYENPEVKPFFQEEAANLLGELQNTIKGEKWYNAQMDYDYGTEAAWGGTKRFTSESIAEMLDGWGMSYADIEKGLNAIIEDNGAENIAAAKKIEFMLNERLLNGYNDFYSNGRIPPNEDYLNLLHEKEITEYSKEAFDRFMETADDYAPAEEVVEDIAPVVEKPAKEAYEAIRPKPEKEPRMARATPAEQARAEILVDEPKVEKKKAGVMSKIRNLVLDKGMVFEDLSLKTGNRELQARWDSIRRAEGRAQRLMESGNASAGSLKSIRESVEQTGKTKQFYEYLYHLHNVDRMTLEDRYEDTQNKPVFGYSVTAETSREAANKLEKANPEFKQFAQDVYNYMGYLREMLVDGGVISGETAKLWAEMYPHYVPIRRVGDEGLNINVPLDTGRTGVNAPVKRATGGNRDILPLFDTMGQRTIQTYKAIAKNRFGVELKNALGTTIDSDALSLDEAIDSMDAQDLLQEGKDGRSPTFTVFENGEKVTFEITDEMYDAMKPKSDALAYTNKTLNTISNLRRGVITEYNPWFLLKNAVKDTQDVLINSQHAVQTYAAIPKALKQMSTNGHWYQEYLDNGGDQDTYFDSETNTVKEENKTVELLKKVTGLDFISKANNVIERLPRLAEYIASRESGRSVDVSMLDAARVTTNFAAGGDLTKFLNRNGATFLNASVQGAMQNVRNVREAKMNGLKGWASLAGKFVAAGLPAIVLNHFIWDDDEEYDELSDYVKQNYYIVGKYGDGKFVRIPKGRTVAVIQNAIEQVSNAVTGNDEADLGSFIELVISNLAPTNPIDNNILSPIIQVANNETWYGEDLIPTRLQDLPSTEQYDETTDSISKWLGENFDPLKLGAYRINYLLDQYSGVLGDTFLPMLTPEAESGNDSILGNMIAPLKDMFTTDSVLKNQNVSDFYDLKDELTVNANASGATDEDVLMSKYMNSVNAELAKLYAEKRKIQNSDLSDAEKYAAVRDVQKQIVELTKDGMDTYSDISFEDDYREGGEYARVGDRLYKLNDEGEWQKLSDEQITKYEVTKAAGDASYATDGENHYRWYEPGEDADADAEPGWRKVTDKELERQEEVTSGLGITADEYWSNKEEYAYAYDHPENYAVAKAVGGYEAYRNYSSELYDIKADKDANGKSISGSRKEKVLEYINNLDADYYTKIILWKSEYTSDDTYNYEIIDYLNGRDDISFDDMVSILRKLGFNVTDDGNITW